MYDYDDNGNIKAVSFVGNTPDGERGFKLPSNVDAIYEVLKQQRKAGEIRTNPDYSQAERTGWRIIKDWVDAQMAILEAEMVQFEEVFFPYMLNAKGETLFNAYKQKQLTSGEGKG
jgi:choline kinase